MTKWKVPEETPGPPDKKNNNGKYCKSCNRRMSEHKQKVFGRWVCDVALLDDGNWVHVDRLPVEGRQVVAKLREGLNG